MIAAITFIYRVFRCVFLIIAILLFFVAAPVLWPVYAGIAVLRPGVIAKFLETELW